MADKRLAVLGDRSDHGGSIISTPSTVRTGGGRLAIEGAMHACPIKGHGVTPVSGEGTAMNMGRRLIRTGCKAACGASIIGSGSAMFRV